jgi:hypothetical protein
MPRRSERQGFRVVVAAPEAKKKAPEKGGPGPKGFLGIERLSKEIMCSRAEEILTCGHHERCDAHHRLDVWAHGSRR